MFYATMPRMAQRRKRIVAANWKMNPQTADEAWQLFSSVKKIASKLKHVDTIICPPFVYLLDLSYSYKGKNISFGAQDIFWEEKGSFTGEISARQAHDAGARYVIIGHSERRALGETDEDVARKVGAVLKERMHVILCIGEHERDNHGNYLGFLRNQLEIGLGKVKSRDLGRIIVAYEPIWAIGKSGDDAITPDKLHETTLFIKRILVERYTKNALATPVIYGGSVEEKNARGILERGEVAGFLVGHASLDADEFGNILKIANTTTAL